MRIQKRGKFALVLLGMIFLALSLVAGCCSKGDDSLYIADSYTDEDAHITDDAVCECVDFNFNQTTTMSIQEGLKTTSYDGIALAGASLALAYTPKGHEHWRLTLIDQIEIVVSKHHVKTFTFINHMKCAALEMCFGRMNSKAERELHYKILRTARRFMKKHYPRVRVRTILAERVKDGDALKTVYNEIDPPGVVVTPELRAHQPQAPPEQQNVH